MLQVKLLVVLVAGSWGMPQPDGQTRLAYSLNDWSATVQSCWRDRSGRMHMGFRLGATLTNTGKLRLIVPRRLSPSGFEVSLNPVGPKPWNADSETSYDFAWPYEWKPPQSAEPPVADFALVAPGGQERITLEIPDQVLLAQGLAHRVRSIGISAGFLWDAGVQRRPATAETATRWSHIGALVHGLGVTDWILVEIPAESQCRTER